MCFSVCFFKIFFFFISSSLLSSFLRFSPLSFSSLFSCLLLLFSFFFFSLSSSLFSLFLLSLSSFSVFFLCLLGGVCVVVWCGVVCAVWCGTLKTPCVDSKTPPCVDSKRPRVSWQHAHILFSMCACCRHTRRRYESTHGGVLSLHTGGRRQFSLPKNHARRVLTWSQRGSPKVTTGCCPCSSLRKDREQHVPDSSHHSLCLMKLLSSSYPGETLEEPAVRWIDLSFAPMRKSITNDLRVSIS